ncbi:MAG: hypothetical protein LUE61_02905 [Clostridiales bacterium]|nr:hypothetical protein [Clostridiales bacterium]
MTATKKTAQGMVTLRPKRTFVYIILIALFTAVLCLDVVNFATFPAVSTGMAGMTGQFTIETGDTDADTSGAEAEFGGGMTRDFSDADTSGTEAEFGGMAGGFSGAPGGDMGDMADQSGVTAEMPSDGEMSRGGRRHGPDRRHSRRGPLRYCR